MQQSQQNLYRYLFFKYQRASMLSVFSRVVLLIVELSASLASPATVWSQVNMVSQHTRTDGMMQADPLRSHAQTAAQIDTLLTQMTNNQQFSGSVLVAQGGQILLNKGYS